jgi:hypothetical protein
MYYWALLFVPHYTGKERLDMISPRSFIFAKRDLQGLL